MLYFHNTSQKIEKNANYATKGFQILRASRPVALPLDPAGGTAPNTQLPHPPNFCRFPQTSGVWRKAGLGAKYKFGIVLQGPVAM